MEGYQAIAKRFINTTRSHLFLTGKAGTGKTTFLKNLATITHKTFIVVAPTGIAALNAGGVTIHSQFLLPLGTYLPDRSLQDNVSGSFYTQNTLARKHPLNSVRKQVLRSIDLLVIDEVSMLRADLLDAIDYRLKAVRGNFRQSFGGVQVLFIGDLYQLPPVVKREEEATLSQYYASPWFYEAKALQQDRLVFIELDKIYRQHDTVFIDLLNNLRNNQVTAADIEELNKRYRTPQEIESLREVITLTTHNYKADELNAKALRELQSPAHFFTAQVEGDFPESMYPVQYKLELKVGAQVMFVRNDSEGEYFNGKLATVTEISGSDVKVKMAGTGTVYKLKRERWENKKYVLDEGNHDLNEEVVGTFEQFPVKLAWAITVHKSQGLTFEKAIIDVGAAFADGQVYVALSRLRSLDGLILRTRINPQVISTDKKIVSFVDTHHQPEHLPSVMKTEQQNFITHLIDQTFDFSALLKEIQYIIRTANESIHKDVAEATLLPIAAVLEGERVNTEKFRQQLAALVRSDQEMFQQRLLKGSAYYHQVLMQQIKLILQHREDISRLKRVKAYQGQLAELDVAFTKKLEEVNKVTTLIHSILTENDQAEAAGVKEKIAAERQALLQQIQKQETDEPRQVPRGTSQKKKKKKKEGEPSTYDITIALLKQGMSIADIAKERQLTIGTIENHLAKAVETGRIDIHTFVAAEAVEEVGKVISSSDEDILLSQLYQHFNQKYSFGVLRAVTAYMKWQKQLKED